VRPLIYDAICAAYKSAESIVRATDRALDGVSKKAIADSVYDMLPDYIGKFPVVLVKQLVSRERFAELVQAVYDKFDEHFHGWQDDLASEFEKWKSSAGAAQGVVLKFTSGSAI